MPQTKNETKPANEFRESIIGFSKNFVAGALSASVSKTIQAPVDRVKLVLQLQAASVQISKEQQYKGIVDCVQRIYQDQGLLSFWRGNLANVMRFFPTQAIILSCKDQYSALFLDGVTRDQKLLYNLGSLAAGGCAGATALVVTYPLDFARTRLAADVGGGAIERQYTGMNHVLSKTLKEEGITALYRGFGVACFGVVVWRALYLGGYDIMKNHLQGTDENLGVLSKYFAAQSVTTAAGCIVYPLDSVRRRLMMQAGRKDILYRSSLHCVQKVIKDEGPTGLYKGLSANILRGIGGAALLVLYDELSALFSS
mmetsp:Transcript_23632/g.30885  ORF Transcript_23632/g.30885 Transcript_23632/m.30885 type:complete len:312 (+) Transcript_23632:149-1084(+)